MTTTTDKFERAAHHLMEMMQAYERRVRTDCTPEQIDKRPWECAEYVAAADFLRKVWPASDEYGWVIEGSWSHVTKPDYWQGSSAWGTDPDLALRFARKLDAERAASLMLDGVRVRISEHCWTNRKVMVCGVDCRPGDQYCNNYCNSAPQKGPMAKEPPSWPPGAST